MPSKSESDRLLLGRITKALAEDLLADDYPDEEIDALLRKEGGDPAAIAARGEALARDLMKRRRLAWKEPARATRAKMEAAIAARARIPPFPVGDPIPALLAAAESAGMTIGLRSRKPEETSRAELEKLWVRIHEAKALLEADEKDGDR